MALNSTADILALDFIAPAWAPTIGGLVVVVEGPMTFGARVIAIVPGACRGGGLAMVQGTGLDHKAPRWGERWYAPLADLRPAI